MSSMTKINHPPDANPSISFEEKDCSLAFGNHLSDDSLQKDRKLCVVKSRSKIIPDRFSLTPTVLRCKATNKVALLSTVDKNIFRVETPIDDTVPTA